MAKSKKTKWAEVTCKIHGKPEDGMPWKENQVKLSVPATKRKRMSGCPQCRKIKPL